MRGGEFAIAGLTLVLAACSGGGGGGGSSAIPVTTPTTAPSSATVTGTLQDCNWSDTADACAGGTAIANTTVLVSTTLFKGATPPPNAATVTTDASGNFSVSGLSAGNAFVQVFPTDGHLSVHSLVTLTAGSNALGTVFAVKPTADQTGWIAEINLHRANPPAGGTAVPAVIGESNAMIAAMFWADFQAINGFFAHCQTNPQVAGDNCPGQAGAQPLVAGFQAQPSTRYTKFGGVNTAISENIGGNPVGSAGSLFSDNFFNEAAQAGGVANCTQANCGHFLVLMSSTATWVGVYSKQPLKTGAGVSQTNTLLGTEDYVASGGS
jgi:hypothetical protein